MHESGPSAAGPPSRALRRIRSGIACRGRPGGQGCHRRQAATRPSWSLTTPTSRARRNRLSRDAGRCPGQAAGPASQPSIIDTPRGRGRPKLGVVAREVTLLPRHWDWLNRQPGGASVALRKLVEEARHTHRFPRSRAAVAGRGLSLHVDHGRRQEGLRRGDPRLLFARNHVRFDAITGGWPVDIRDHAQATRGGEPSRPKSTLRPRPSARSPDPDVPTRSGPARWSGARAGWR